MRITQYRDMRPLLVQMHTGGSAGERTNYLDAEDQEFIEQVRVRGRLDVGAMSDLHRPLRVATDDQTGNWRYAEHKSREADRSESAFFNEEMLEYWEHRWEFEDNCAAERKLVYEQQQRERQELLKQRAKDRETAAGELAREELAWQKQQEKLAREREKRLQDTMQADIEWENAKLIQSEAEKEKTADWWKEMQAADRVRDAPFSQERHYVPIWDWVERAEKRKKKREEREAQDRVALEIAELRKQEHEEERRKEFRSAHERILAQAVEEGRFYALQQQEWRERQEWEEREREKLRKMDQEWKYPPLKSRYIPLK